jgi:uncharacterized membrane protein YidH (DUF202 family)
MTTGERFYLLLILVGFTVFAVTLGYQSWVQGKADRRSQPAPSPQAGAEHAN